MKKYYLSEYTEENHEKKITPKVEISCEQFNNMISWLSFTGYYSKCSFVKQMVDENARDFLDFITNLQSIADNQDYLQMDPLLKTGNKLLITYLSFIGIFIGTVQSAISEISNEKLEDFKKLDSKLYDEFFGYRFCKRLRNYVVHFGIPLTLLNHNVGTGCFLACDRSALLQFKKWSKIRKEISELPQQIDMRPYISESQVAIDTLYLRSLEYVFDRAVDGYKKFDEVKNDYNIRCPMIICFDNEHSNHSELKPPPIHIVEAYFRDISRHPSYNITFIIEK